MEIPKIVPDNVRNYRPEDFPQVKELYEKLDYQVPILNKKEGDAVEPLWIVTKVLLVDGKIKALAGAHIRVDVHFVVSDEEWGDKEAQLRKLNAETMDDLYWLKGIDYAVAWAPKESRDTLKELLTNKLGFTEAEDNWLMYTRLTQQQPKQ